MFDPDKKIEFYNKIILLKEDTPEAYYLLGKVYMIEKHDVESALPIFKRYLRYVPRSDPKAKELRNLIWNVESET